MGFFAKIKEGLQKTRDAMMNNMRRVLNSFTKIDEELFEELEETMIMSDMGVDTSVEICDRLRKLVKERGVTDPQEIMGLIEEIIGEMMGDDTALDLSTTPSVIMVIGVNGAGKTTTIGKLCHQFKQDGKKVLVAAADTFRAAAIDQLEVWTQRAGVDIVKHAEGSDPGAVVFDAVSAAIARKCDVLIIDTAGRLHNKSNLMRELEKVNRILTQKAEGCAIETLLVLDATTGQNAVSQAKLFSEVTNITGIVLTKLDGTAKGGIVVSIKNELGIPVKLVGVGEKIEDLQVFDNRDFVRALFDHTQDVKLDSETAEENAEAEEVADEEVPDEEVSADISAESEAAAEEPKKKKGWFSFGKKKEREVQPLTPAGDVPMPEMPEDEAFGVEAEQESAAEVEPVAEPEPVAEVETVAEPEPVAEQETAAESEPEVAAEVEPVAEPEIVAEQENIAEAEPIVEAEPETVVEAEPVAESEPVAEPETVAEVEPVEENKPETPEEIASDVNAAIRDFQAHVQEEQKNQPVPFSVAAPAPDQSYRPMYVHTETKYQQSPAATVGEPKPFEPAFRPDAEEKPFKPAFRHDDEEKPFKPAFRHDDEEEKPFKLAFRHDEEEPAPEEKTEKKKKGWWPFGKKQ